MEQYHKLLKEILGKGDVMYEPRTEEFILGIGGWQSIYDLREGFPLMTTKNVAPRLAFEELFWKLRGERSVKSLVERGVNYWNANAFDKYLKTNKLSQEFPKHSEQWNGEFARYQEKLKTGEESGDLGPVYGYQWRHWQKPVFVEGYAAGTEWIPEHIETQDVDQLENLLKGIKEKPGSRYHLLSAWNVADLSEMALGPCPMVHQFSVFGKNIDLNMYQRSCDVFLGVPFNIAQDSLLTHMVARETNLEPRKFIHSYGNVHSYLGVPPRANFWTDEKNVKEFQGKFGEIKDKEQYLDLKKWYLENAPEESKGNERKDHIPFILEQLSRKPTKLPYLEFNGNVPLLEAIKNPAMNHLDIVGYHPQKWDSKANMAA